MLLYIKYSKDKELLSDLLERDPRFRELDTKAAIVIDTVTKSGLKFDRKERTVDMCLAVREMRMESWNEGEKKATVRLNKLNSILIRENRIDDLKRTIEDPMYQTKLMSELLSDEEGDWDEQ